MALSLAILAFIFVIGLVIGSFLNVVILRTVSGESIVFPSSKCPKCQTPLKWWHNIPVLSYIFLRGKCAFCSEKISIQYPIVELFTGIMFVFLFFKICRPFDAFFGLSVINPIDIMSVINYVFILIVLGLFITMAGTDIIEKKIANIHVYSLIGVGIFYSFVSTVMNLLYYIKEVGMPKLSFELFITCPLVVSILTGLVGFVIMESLSLLGVLLVKKRAFGDGDSYIAAGIGTVFGALLASNINVLSILKLLIGILILAGILQIFVTLPMFVKKLINEKQWITISLMSSFLIYAIGFIFAQNNGWLTGNIAYILSTLVLLALGILTCKELLYGLRKNNDNDNNNNEDEEKCGLYLPFGPALFVSALIFILVL